MTTLKEIAQYLVNNESVSIRYVPHAFISVTDLDIFISYHVATGEISILTGYDQQLTWEEFIKLLK